MIDLLTSSPSIWFTIPALVGTIFFAVRLVMALVGMDFAEGADGDAGASIDAGDASADDAVDHAETASVFRFISIQTITAFAMGFGWGGLMALHTMNLDLAPSVAVAIGIGVGFAWFIIWLLKLMYAMESSGNISIEQAYSAEGVTTSPLPASGEGTGRVRVTVSDRQRAYSAHSDGDAIPMGTRIRVVRVNRDNSLTVTVVAPSPHV